MIPVIKPSTVIITGNIKGAMLNNMVIISPPLMILPNNLTAKARVLESSLITLKGSIIKLGCIYVFRYPIIPLSAIPYKGTAINTDIASAAVVDSELVGGSYPGKTIQIFAKAIKTNMVPIKSIYFSGFLRPISFIC